MDSNMLNLDIKDEVDIKEEILDFANYEFESEDSEQCKLRNSSNESQTIIKTGEGDLFNSYIKEEEAAVGSLSEEAATDPLSEEWFRLCDNDDSKYSEVPEEKSDSKVHYTYFREDMGFEYLNGFTSDKEDEPKMEMVNLNKNSENVSECKPGRFQCHFCSFRGKRNYDLQRHLSVHSNSKPFKCPHCDSAFKQNSTLKMHLVVHSNLKPFKCPHCDSSFKENSALKRHLVAHSDLKPFKCSYCEATFKQKGVLANHLANHLAGHSDLRPFKCLHCDLTFKDKYSLKRHLVVHSDINPFKCSHCESKFRYKHDLKKHLPIHRSSF